MTEWTITREIKPKEIKCDLCGKQADTIHFLPWVAGEKPCEEVKFACPDHNTDPQGYMITIADWFAPAKSTRSGRLMPTTAEHIEQKINGWQALSVLDDRFREIKRRLAERDAA